VSDHTLMHTLHWRFSWTDGQTDRRC